MSSQPSIHQLPFPHETQPFPDTPSPASYPNNSTTWTPVDGLTPISTNPSRKRSRDETYFDSDVDGSYIPSQQVNPPEPIPEEPIYGEGMVLLNPQTGISISAESQTGTWYEEKVEHEAKEPPALPSTRPRIYSRKTVRLSESGIKPMLDNVISAPSSPPRTSQPEVDDATIALGIGWTKIATEDPDIQAAARGWAKYLENHYRLIHGAEILLKSSGLNAYLVGSQEGFFLFSEDLLEGRLVGRSWEVCLNNLRSQPIAFEGDDVLRAERTPGPDMVEKMENWADYHRLNGSNGEVPVTVNGGGMELD